MICTICNHDKPKDGFGTYMVGKYGPYRRKQCKQCMTERDKVWRHNHAEHARKRSRVYRVKNRDRVLSLRRARYDPQKNAIQCKKNREKHLGAMRTRARECYRLMKETDPQKYRQRLLWHKKYRQKNWGKLLEEKNRDKQAYRSTPKGHLHSAMSVYIYHALRDRKAGRKWETLVGYSLADLMAHLESRFKPGMTWDNYGQWHIDHVRPIASFSFANPEDEGFKQCWSLSNLQPLWAKENIQKGAKWTSNAA